MPGLLFFNLLSSEVHVQACYIGKLVPWEFVVQIILRLRLNLVPINYSVPDPLPPLTLHPPVDPSVFYSLLCILVFSSFSSHMQGSTTQP